MSKSIEVGARVRAEWLEARTTCLAGSQFKLGATAKQVVGTVQGFAVPADLDPASYGPDNPPPREHVWVRIAPEEGGEPVNVKLDQIREVLPPKEG